MLLPRTRVLAALVGALALAVGAGSISLPAAATTPGGVTGVVQAGSWEQAWGQGSPEVLRGWFEANTGPSVALETHTRGVWTVDSQRKADELVGRTVTGRVVVTVSDVHLRDFKVVNDGSGTETLSVKGGVTGVVIERFEIDGGGHLGTVAAVGGGSWANVTIRHAHIHHSLDGVRLFEGSTYEYVFVEDAVANPDYVRGTSSQHADAVQVVRAGKPISVRRSWLDHSEAGPNVTSVAMIKSDAAAVDDVSIESSYLNGGGYTVTVEAGPHGAPTDISVAGNRFGRDYRHGIWSGAGVSEGTGYDLSGNVWADTLTPVTTTWGWLPATVRASS